MEEKKQQQQTNDELKQNTEGEYSLEELDRRIPFTPHEESKDAWE